MRFSSPLFPMKSCHYQRVHCTLVPTDPPVGGGIFLSPLLVLFGWAHVRSAAAPTAAFILVNSVAGLAGLYAKQPTLPEALPYWLIAVIAGGLIGSWLGAHKLNLNTMRRVLALVLVVAGAKMIF
mgnify:CR=1 FL=1